MQVQRENGNRHGVRTCNDMKNEFQSNDTNQSNQFPPIGLHNDEGSMNMSIKPPIEPSQNYRSSHRGKKQNQESNHEESLELQTKVESLKAELESVREQNFDLNATLLTVQAESTHEIKSTHSKTDEKIRLMQDTLRRCEMENNKLKAMLAEEKKKRRDLSIKKYESCKKDPVISRAHCSYQEANATQSSPTTVTPTTEMQKVSKKRTIDSTSNNNIMNMSSTLDNELHISVESSATRKSLLQPQKTTYECNESPISYLKKMRLKTTSPRRHQYPNDYELAEYILSQQRVSDHMNPFSRTISVKRTDWTSQTRSAKFFFDKSNFAQNSMNEDGKGKFPLIPSGGMTSNMMQIENSILSSILQEMISSKGTNQQNKTIVLIKTILQILSSHYTYFIKSEDGMNPVFFHNNCVEFLFALRLIYVILSISPFAIRNLIHWSITSHLKCSMPSSKGEGRIPDVEQNSRLQHNFSISKVTHQQITMSTNSNYKMCGNECYNLIEKFDSLIYHFITVINYTQVKNLKQNQKILKLRLKFGKVFRIEAMRIITLLVYKTENKLFQKIWLERFFLDQNSGFFDNKDIGDEIRKDCNLFTTVENVLDMTLESNESQKLELLSMVSCFLSVTPSGVQLSLENKKKIAFPCLQYLEKWYNGIYLLQTSFSSRDTHHLNCSLDIVYRIIQICETLSREWKDGVTIFFCFLRAKEKKQNNDLMTKITISGVAILIEVFNALVSLIFMTSSGYSSNDTRFRLKQLLLKIVEFFTLVVNHTQNLRQTHEETNVEVSQWVSFLSIISERQEMFCSCCNIICNQDSNNYCCNFVDEKVIQQCKIMLEEIECDIDEVDEMRI